MEKTYISTQKFVVEGPRKLREVVALAKKLKPVDAVNRLPFVNKRAAANLNKVIKSAIANARTQGVSDTDLVFKEIQIGEGPRLKRGNAASRGRWHPFAHRMSHIRVVLIAKTNKSEVAKPKPETKEVKAEEVKAIAKKTVKAKVVKDTKVKKGASK